MKKILIINSILYTSERSKIPSKKSIKDTMIYNLSNGFVENDCIVDLIASESFKPPIIENYNLNIFFLKDYLKKIFKPNLLPFHPQLITFMFKIGRAHV